MPLAAWSVDRYSFIYITLSSLFQIYSCIYVYIYRIYVLDTFMKMIKIL